VRCVPIYNHTKVKIFSSGALSRRFRIRHDCYDRKRNRALPNRSFAWRRLPDVFASDADRVARFEREAKLLASLNHANIAALYGMEQADGKHFLVMELVEGETLAERIARAPIPLEESLKIAHQIAEALEAAHEKGVIHRDLKPANVKITPEGKVKVLDFGLAKALEAAPAQIASNSPTLLSAAASNAGMILGTAGYTLTSAWFCCGSFISIDSQLL